jgi:HK97 family phage portal protein
MGLLDVMARFLALEPYQTEVRNRAGPPDPFESWDHQLARIRGDLARPWRPASVREALGVPAVYRAVTLIANTVGALSMEAYRDGLKMAPADAPRIISRPNPLTTAREFFRETAYSMAAYGEAWWWIARRDADDLALSLYPMPPHEVTVQQNDRDYLRPIIEWRGRRMRNEDVRQIVFSRDPGDLRGSGPLQRCGAAVSVAVEAQEWAANFFAEGGAPSMVIKSAVDITEDEAKDLKRQWVETPPNVPRVIDPTIEDIKDFGLDPQKAQLTDTRFQNRGDVAVMFGIPGSLLEYSMPGASLTYQNVGQEFDKFVRASLWPGYLEPTEQTISDLLTRSTVARFSLSGLLRPDEKTRYEIHKLAIETGVYPAEHAQEREGIVAGDVETAPVPFSPPQAVPTILPIQGRTELREVICQGVYSTRGRMVRCNRRLGSVTPPASLYCPRCKAETEVVA